MQSLKATFQQIYLAHVRRQKAAGKPYMRPSAVYFCVFEPIVIPVFIRSKR